MEELHKIAGMYHTAIWTEISRSIPDHFSGQEYLREIAAADTDPRIGLRILEQDVIARFVLLDKVVFKQQGIGLRLHHGIFRIRYLGDHDGGLAGKSLGRHKILRHTLVKVFCLTHIYHIPLGIIISVDSGGMRK